MFQRPDGHDVHGAALPALAPAPVRGRGRREQQLTTDGGEGTSPRPLGLPGRARADAVGTVPAASAAHAAASHRLHTLQLRLAVASPLHQHPREAGRRVPAAPTAPVQPLPPRCQRRHRRAHQKLIL